MKKLLSVLALSVIIFTCQAKVLNLNLKAGKVYQQELANQMEIKLKIEGKEMLIHGNFDLVMEYLIKSVDADVYETQMSLKNINGNVSSDQFALSFDTVTSQNNPLGAVFNGLVNKPMVYTMSNTGKIIEFKDMSGLDLNLNLSGDTTLSKLLEESMNTNSGGLMQSIYPDHEVAVGDSWTISTRIPNSEAEINNTYTWKSSKGGKNIIEMSTEDFKFDFSFPIKGGKEEISMRIQLEGNSGGEYQLNKKTGWIEASESRFDAECKVTLAPNAQMPEGAEFPLNIKVVSKLDQVK
ncbi:MAG: DUF6263 family protein [Bacteroidales bacterium]|nr:DUF6263 family protein [Bacteroidales bacterium]